MRHPDASPEFWALGHRPAQEPGWLSSPTTSWAAQPCRLPLSSRAGAHRKRPPAGRAVGEGGREGPFSASYRRSRASFPTVVGKATLGQEQFFLLAVRVPGGEGHLWGPDNRLSEYTFRFRCEEWDLPVAEGAVCAQALCGEQTAAFGALPSLTDDEARRSGQHVCLEPALSAGDAGVRTSRERAALSDGAVCRGTFPPHEDGTLPLLWKRLGGQGHRKEVNLQEKKPRQVPNWCCT